MATTEKNPAETASAAEWLSFWDSIRNPDRVTLIIGFIVLMFFVVFLGYFGTRSIARSLDYYRMSFSASFIEDIRPGTKVRYQGALEIGEVEYLKSDMSGHHIVAKIRTDFPIPKTGSRASLSSWGYFGAKFINIEIVPSTFNETFYSLEQSMPLEKIINSTIMFQQYYDAIKSEGGNLSILEKRLQQLKKTVDDLKKIPYIQRHAARATVRQATGTMNIFFGVINSTSSDLYTMLSRVNNVSEFLVYDLNKNLPAIKTSMAKLEQSVAYDGQSFSARLLHEETIYLLLLDYAKYANEKLNDMASAPYRIFFNN
ncbi:MAG: MCE family protein [Turneriella sp.]|nr:MCE family protein [Turneriella sp.]